MSDSSISPVAVGVTAVVADRRQRQDQQGQRPQHGDGAEGDSPRAGASAPSTAATPPAPTPPPAEDDTQPVDAGTLFAATLLANAKPANPPVMREIAGVSANEEWQPPESDTHLTDRTV